jgi:glycosyltransferase involved in cell wall biosynthesis
MDETPVTVDQQGEAYGHRRNPQPVEALKSRLNQRPFNQAAALVTWSRWAALSLINDYGVDASRIRVVPPGVDVGLFRPPERPRDEAPPPARVLFVGAPFEPRGSSDLMEAMRRLGGRAELDVVTDAEMAGVPEGVIVRVHRGLSPESPELAGLYREADVFALPSWGPCTHRVLAEALASGLPIVAADVGAVSEMVNNQVNGYIVPARNPRALGGALEVLVADAGKRAALGRWSRALAEKDHDAGKNNRAIFALMKAISQPLQPAAAG